MPLPINYTFLTALVTIFLPNSAKIVIRSSTLIVHDSDSLIIIVIREYCFLRINEDYRETIVTLFLRIFEGSSQTTSFQKRMKRNRYMARKLPKSIEKRKTVAYRPSGARWLRPQRGKASETTVQGRNHSPRFHPLNVGQHRYRAATIRTRKNLEFRVDDAHGHLAARSLINWFQV